MGSRLIDTNVVLRVLCCDIQHPRYSDAVRYCIEGGAIRDYVMPEIIYGYIAHKRVGYSRALAESLGEIDKWNANPKLYSKGIAMPSGWRRQVYAELKPELIAFLSQYPSIIIDQKDLFDMAMGIACETGHDWVDCMLEAERQFGWVEVASLDKDLASSAPTQDGPASTKPGGSQASKLSLPK